MKVKARIIANWMQGYGLSGADRIFIEMSKRLTSLLDITIFISREGFATCQRMGLKDVTYQVWASDRFNRLGYFINYFYRTLNSLFKALSLKLEGEIVYSSSDFLPDLLPAFILKIRNRKIRWLAGFYLFAPKPWQRHSPYRGWRWFTGFFYWLTQRPAYCIINKYADMVFVTSEPDVNKFVSKKRAKDKIVVVRGGVDIGPSEEYLASGHKIPFEKRSYDACFIGRFHYQKGVLAMIDIWNRVVQKRRNAKLAMIGDGPLESEARKIIGRTKLEKNIDLLGFLDGVEKYAIFKNSKIIVHPATYDSGGMAAAEAMAWGLPAVSFDLEALKTYYAKGMLKTSCFDLDEFAANILRLLNDKELYEKTSQEALAYIRQEWDWDRRAEDIFNLISKT